MEYWIDLIYLGPAVVGSQALPESWHLRAGSVSLIPIQYLRGTELNLLLPLLVPACLVGSFCRRSSAGPILSLFPLTTKFPLFCRPKAELTPALREVQRGDFLSPGCLFPGSRGWRLVAGVQPGPLTFTCQAWEENILKVPS